MPADLNYLLQARRNRYAQPAGGSRSSGSQEDPRAAVEEEAFQAESKRLALAAKEQQAASEDAAKAYDKGRKDAEKEALRARNNEMETKARREKRPIYTDADGAIQSQYTDDEWQAQKERKAKNDQLRTQYFKENRPWVEDAEGNMVPRHTDAEWQAQKAEKLAKEKAKQLDDQTKAWREQKGAALTNVDDQTAQVMRTLDLEGQDLGLQHKAKLDTVKKANAQIKFLQEEIESGQTETEKPLDSVAIAKRKEYRDKLVEERDKVQAEADAAEAKVRAHEVRKLEYSKANNEVQGWLQQQKHGLKTEMPPVVMGVKGDGKEKGGFVSGKGMKEQGNAGAGSGTTDFTSSTDQSQSQSQSQSQLQTGAPSTDEAVRKAVIEGRISALAEDDSLSDEERAAGLTRLMLQRDDPAAYEAQVMQEFEGLPPEKLNQTLEEHLQDFNGRKQDWQARRDALRAQTQAVNAEVDGVLARNKQRLLQPHKAADLITYTTADGGKVSVFKDLAPQLEQAQEKAGTFEKQHQAEMDQINAEGGELERAAKLIHAGGGVFQKKQEVARVAAQAERQKVYQQLNALPGAKLGDDLAAVDAAVAKHQGGDDVSLHEWAAQEREKIVAKAQEVQQKVGPAVQAAYAAASAKMPAGADLNAEFDRDPQGIFNEATSESLAVLRKGLGMEWGTKAGEAWDAKQGIQMLRDAAVLDWSRGDTAAPVRTDSAGRVLVNPERWTDDEAYAAAVAGAGASEEQKAKALEMQPELKAQAIKLKLETLRTLGVFNDWEQAEVEPTQAEKMEAQANGTKAVARQVHADLSDEEKLKLFEKENSGVFSTGAWQVRWNQALLGAAQGVIGLGQSVTGLAAPFSDDALEMNRRLGKDAAQLGAGSQSLPTGQWVNQGASMLVSSAPALAVGGAVGAATRSEALALHGAAAGAGLQTFGQVYGDAVQGYMQNKGMSKAEARKAALVPALASGASTYALTAAGGTNGMESVLRQEGFKQGLKQWLTTVGKGALKEGVLEEGPDQLIQGVIARHGYDPTKSWDSIWKETATAVIGGALMGGGFEMMAGADGKDGTKDALVSGKGMKEQGNAGAGGGTTDFTGSTDGSQSQSPSFAEATAGAPSNESGRVVTPAVASPEPAKAGTTLLPEDGSQSQSKPEARATVQEAEAEIASFAPEGMAGHQVAATKAKAEVLLRMAQGETLNDFTDEELRHVGLNRDGTPGHYESVPVDKKNPQGARTSVWKKGVRDDGFQPVVVEDGELIITQRQIDNLGKRLPAVAAQIGKSEVERRREIGAKKAPAAEAQEDAKPEDKSEVGAVSEKVEGSRKITHADAQRDFNGPDGIDAPGFAAYVTDEVGAALSEGRKVVLMADGGKKEVPIVAVEKGMMQDAEGNRWGTMPMLFAKSEGVVIGPKPKEVIPGMASQEPAQAGAAVPPENGNQSKPEARATGEPEAFDPVVEKRVDEISAELAGRGLSGEQALKAARGVVGRMGVMGPKYEVQMIDPAFEEAMKAEGFQRDPAKMSRWIARGQFKAETRGEKPAMRRSTGDGEDGRKKAQESEKKGTEAGGVTTDGTGSTDGNQSQSPSSAKATEGAPSYEPEGRAKPMPALIERSDWKQAQGEVIAGMQGRAKGLAEAGKKAAADKIKAVVKRFNKLEELIDTKFGRLFEGVRIVPNGSLAGGGLAAQVTGYDGQGRATGVELLVDAESFAAGGGITDAELERALNEEWQHRADLMVMSRSEAIALARDIHAAQPGVFHAAWKQYFAVQIKEGSMPAKPPVELTDDEAYMLYFEASRMIRQGTFTSENAAIRDVGLLQRMYLMLSRYVNFVRREMKKLPQYLRELWEDKLTAAESVMRKTKQAGIRLQKEHLDDVEPPERAQPKKGKEEKKGKPVNEDEEAMAMAADAEMDTQPERKGALRNPGENAIRGMAAIPDPDTGKENVVVWINRYHGRITRPSKGWLARMAQDGKDRSKMGDWDDIRQAEIPSFYAGLVFKNGNGSTLDQALQELHGLGYFPGVATEDVTGEMLARKIKDVIARYQGKKQGGATTVQDEEQAHFERMEKQRVEFERSTAKGPIYVKPHEMQPGDVMMVKADDGKMHRVEVLRLDTAPVPAGEEFDPDANPAQFMGPDGPMEIRSVTLKDGTTFGVQTIDGQQGLYVDAFSVRQEGDFYAGLSDAVQNRTIDDADAVLRVMQHEGMDATTPFAQIVLAIQQNLRVPMKRAQKMLGQVMDTEANATVWTNEELKQALQSPLGEEPKPKKTAKPKLADLLRAYFVPGKVVKSYGGFDRVVSLDVSNPNDWSVTVRAVRPTQGERINPTTATQAQIEALGWQDVTREGERTHATLPAQKEMEKAWEKQNVATALGSPKKQAGPGLFGEDEMNFLGDRNTLGLGERKGKDNQTGRQSDGETAGAGGDQSRQDVGAPSPEPGFALEASTPQELKAEAERKVLREKLQARAEKPLVGTLGDIGQTQMFGGGDLFAQPGRSREALFSPRKQKPILETIERVQEWFDEENKAAVIESLPQDLQEKITADPRWVWLESHTPTDELPVPNWLPAPYHDLAERYHALEAKAETEDGLSDAEDREKEEVHDKLFDWELDDGPHNAVIASFQPEIEARLKETIADIEATGRWKWDKKAKAFEETGEDNTQVLYSPRKQGGNGGQNTLKREQRTNQSRQDVGAPSTEVDAAAHEAATSPRNDLPEPTLAQKEEGNYKLGHVSIGGHEISIENPAGSRRRPEWPVLKDHYGYFRSMRVPQNSVAQSGGADLETASQTSQTFSGLQPGVDAVKVIGDLVSSITSGNLSSSKNPSQGVFIDTKSPGYLRARNAFANQVLSRLKVPRDVPSGSVKTELLEATRDGLATDAKLFGDSIQGMLLRTEGFNKLDVQGKAMVKRHMLSAIENPKILHAVVQLIPVQVMDMDGGRKIFSSNNKAMLLEGLTAALNDPVMAGRILDGVATSLPPAFALRIAKRVLDSGKPPLAPMKTGAAEGTTDGRHVDTPTRVSPKGKDGEHLDVFVKPGTPADYAGPVHVVRQNVVEPIHGRKEAQKAAKTGGGQDSQNSSIAGFQKPELRATGKLDEYKVMLGYATAEEARAAYLRNYTPGWPGLAKLTTHTMPEFEVIKRSVFGGDAGARATDKALASPRKQGQGGGMADPDKAAHNAEPSPGGLSEAEESIKRSIHTDLRYDYDNKVGRDAVILWRGEMEFPRVKSVKIIGGDSSSKSTSIYPTAAVSLSNGGVFLKRFRVANHGQVSQTAFRGYDLDYRLTQERNESDVAFNKRILAQAEPDLIAAAKLAWEGQMKELRPFTDKSYADSLKQQKDAQRAKDRQEILRDDLARFEKDRSALPLKRYSNRFGVTFENGTLTDPNGNKLGDFQSLDNARFWTRDNWLPESSRAEGGTLGAPRKQAKALEMMAKADWGRIDKALTGRLAAAVTDAAAWIKKQALPGEAQVNPVDAALELLAGWSVEGQAAMGGVKLKPAQKQELLAQTRRQMRRFWNQAVRQFVPDASLPADVLAKKREMTMNQGLSNEVALDIGKRALAGKPKLSDLVVGEAQQNPEIRRKMFLAMNPRIDSGVTMDSLNPEERRVAEALLKLRDDLGKRMVKAGRIGLQTYEAMREGTSHYYDHDVKREKSLLRQMSMGLRNLFAQTATAYHIVDTQTKQPDGSPALVMHPGSRNRPTYRFDTQEQMRGWYEEFLKDQILQAAEKGNAVRYPWMTPADKAALMGVTRDSLNNPGRMSAEQRAVVARLQEQLRDRFEKRMPLSYDEHSKAGLIEDPFYSVARQIAEMGHDVATAEFFNSIAAVPDYVRDAPTIGYTEMPDTAKLGALAGKYVRDDVAAEVQQLTDLPVIGMKFYDALLGLFKTGKTVLNPGSHGRNIVGNIAFAHLAGSNPLNPGNATYYADALRVLREGGADYREMYENGVLGGDFLTGEVKRSLRQLVPDAATVLREAESGNLTWLYGLKEHMARRWQGLLKKPGQGLELAATAWRLEDDIYKAAAYLKAKGMGMTSKAAAEHVREWFPYYDKGTSGTLKFLGRFAFPFLSFKRESFRILKNGLTKKPLATITTLALPRLLTQIALTMAEMRLLMWTLGLGLKDERDKEDVMKALKGRAGRLLSPIAGDTSLFSILLPWRDDNGGVQQWDLSNTHPFGDWLATRIKDAESQEPWIARQARELLTGSPFVSLLVESAFNKDSFTGRRIYEDDMSSSEATDKLLEHAFTELAPPITPTIPLPGGVKLEGTSARTIRKAFEQSPSKLAPARNPTQAVIRAVLGLDVRPADPNLYEDVAKYREKNKLPAVPRGQQFPSDAVGRARAELYRLLIQPEVDVPAVKAQLEVLTKHGAKIPSVQDLFKDRQPQDVMKLKKHQTRWMNQLAPEARRVLEAAQAQQSSAKPKALDAMAKARAGG